MLFCETQAGAVGPNGRGYALFLRREWHDKNRAPMAHSSPPPSSADHISYLLQIVSRFRFEAGLRSIGTLAAAGMEKTLECPFDRRSRLGQ